MEQRAHPNKPLFPYSINLTLQTNKENQDTTQTPRQVAAYKNAAPQIKC